MLFILIRNPSQITFTKLAQLSSTRGAVHNWYDRTTLSAQGSNTLLDSTRGKHPHIYNVAFLARTFFPFKFIVNSSSHFMTQSCTLPSWIWSTLPGELVLSVLHEYSAISRRSALDLCLVSVASRRLAIPRAYRSIDLNNTNLSMALKLFAGAQDWFKLGFALDYVRAIRCTELRDTNKTHVDLPRLISLCSNVQKIFIADGFLVHWRARSPHGPLHARQLTIIGYLKEFDALAGIATPNLENGITASTCFLTHLHISDDVAELDINSLRKLYPCLQYLALPVYSRSGELLPDGFVANSIHLCEGMVQVVYIQANRDMALKVGLPLLAIRERCPFIYVAWANYQYMEEDLDSNQVEVEAYTAQYWNQEVEGGQSIWEVASMQTNEWELEIRAKASLCRLPHLLKLLG